MFGILVPGERCVFSLFLESKKEVVGKPVTHAWNDYILLERVDQIRERRAGLVD